MKTVLVTGASGQLGSCLQKIANERLEIDWLFLTSAEMSVSSKKDLRLVFGNKQIDYCINCAAYTNVEKAESEKDKAFDINATAVKELALICKEHNLVLIHISTDYVFDGEKELPYLETDLTNPINVYGASKLQGEKHIQEILDKYFIFRTSWLYSQFGHNFFKTVLKKAYEGETLNITTAQTGTPTNANDLAEFLTNLIVEGNANYGLYHFSNLGATTWYGFAKKILEITALNEKVELNKDTSYTTIAKRPQNSVLDKEKLETSFKIDLNTWEKAVEELLRSEYKDLLEHATR
ncbi:dTDP-4-dehydrorhamnose reductase [Gillisia sp. M10.2A]|uniref:dTDP-4-dehydrorhamnose reductase n=1 Tax=Gillisia lutea TaxID=2909668 RepID=A0ABS9ECP8_9FLAO|nr:dTDP-4-dehydrorhamnose reductase [Gillisia lutea]MCF4100656.1 dTDP-4-dehydrorhamnose reductase [Gillisia lutea]